MFILFSSSYLLSSIYNIGWNGYPWAIQNCGSRWKTRYWPRSPCLIGESPLPPIQSNNNDIGDCFSIQWHPKNQFESNQINSINQSTNLPIIFIPIPLSRVFFLLLNVNEVLYTSLPFPSLVSSLFPSFPFILFLPRGRLRKIGCLARVKSGHSSKQTNNQTTKQRRWKKKKKTRQYYLLFVCLFVCWGW